MKLLKKLKANRFAKNFLKLFSATLVAQAITILLSPVLTRLYSPEDFGVYSLYMAIISLIIVYATGRYEFAISIAKTDKESTNLFKLVILLSLFSSILIALLIALLGDKFNILLGFEKYPTILYYVPLTIVFLGIMQGLNYYYNRQKNFSSISAAKILQSVGTGSSSIGFAYMNFHTLGMIWANILGIVLANIYNISRTKLWRIFYFSKADIKELKEVALKYKNYPLWNSTSAFFDVLALQAPILILGRFFSEAVVGFYSLTVRVVGLPITIISSAVAQVYLSEIAEKENKGEPIGEMVKKAAKMLAIIGIFPTIFLIIFSPFLFKILFGEEWILSGELATILAFSYYAKFIVSPLSVVFFVKNAVKELSILQMIRAITTVITLVITSLISKSFLSVITIYTIHELIFYFIYWICILKVTVIPRKVYRRK